MTTSPSPAPREPQGESIPAAFAVACSDCDQPYDRFKLRELGDKRLCPRCFQTVVEAAQAALSLGIGRGAVGGRKCSECRAMVDPSIGSAWCGVYELGLERAVLCDRYTPLAETDVQSGASENPVTPAALWSLVRGELENAVGPGHLQWLEATRPLSLQGHVLHVDVPDEYTRSWLLARLMPAISRCLELNGHGDVTVELDIRGLSPPAAPPERTEESRRPSTIPLAPCPPPARSGATVEQSPHRSGRFNPAFSFEHFIVGTGNRLAQAGALAIAEGSRDYNPLFLYGGVGVGKTHLLQAIGGRCLTRGREALYISSETFTNELIAAIRSGETDAFRRRYRSIDVLLVDDIHFIIGKDSTQQEFFHTFNWLYDNQKQIVLGSDRAPDEMRILDERLRSRFWCGLTAHMHPPDYTTRIEILRRKALQRQRTLPDDVLAFLAGRRLANVRELEGLLNRLLAMSDVHGIEPSLSLAESLCSARGEAGGIRGEAGGREDIIQAVAAYFRLTSTALRGKRRDRKTSAARHTAMYLLRNDGELSLNQIGDTLGGRDHSTVLYGCERVARAIASSDRLAADVEAVRALVARGPAL